MIPLIRRGLRFAFIPYAERARGLALDLWVKNDWLPSAMKMTHLRNNTFRSASSVLLSAFAISACASPAPEPAASPEASPEPAPAPAYVEEEPTEEELEAERAAQKLEEDRAQMQGYAQVELRRWTPELRENAKKLAEAKYATLDAGVKAALQGEHRMPGSAERDSQRHPLETLKFFGLTPKMRVIEYLPGEGWYTEILAPVLHAQGKLYVTTTDPDGPKDSRATLYAERTRLFLSKSKELYGKVEPLVVDPENPALKLEEPVDMVLMIRGIHGLVRQDKVDTWLEVIHGALKDKGTFGVVQHRAKEGADPKEAAEKGYVPEAWLIERIEAGGFALKAKSEINANPKDTKDYPEGVWALPPSLRLGEKDRQKYVDIGESDRMTLRFEKVAKEPVAKK